jgi:hypothetical protein
MLRTIERLFDVHPLTERDARANDLLDCFDFNQPAPTIDSERAPGLTRSRLLRADQVSE